MILSLGLGEPNYVPDSLLGRPQDRADVNYLAFLQCYARRPIHWQILCFFSDHQDGWYSLDGILAHLDQPLSALAAGLAGFAAGKLLDERILVTGPVYRLTHVPELRRSALRLGLEWRL